MFSLVEYKSTNFRISVIGRHMRKPWYRVKMSHLKGAQRSTRTGLPHPLESSTASQMTVPTSWFTTTKTTGRETERQCSTPATSFDAPAGS
jgi:hypothetical protein